MPTLKQTISHLKNRVKSQVKYAIDPQLIYGKTSFYEDKRQNKSTSVGQVAELIWETFDPKTVIDIGCGKGLFLAHLHAHGVEVLGCDISEAALKVSPQMFTVFQADVTKPLRFNRRFDLAICVEIAEHIPTRYSKMLVENVTKASDTVFFTAALPWQGGVGHINEQPHQFWIELFADEGYILDKALTDGMRQELEERNVLFWLYKNLLIFRRRV